LQCETPNRNRQECKQCTLAQNKPFQPNFLKVSCPMPSVTETKHMDDQPSLIPLSEDLEEAIETVRSCPCCGSPTIMVPSLVCKHCNEEIDIKAFVYEQRGVFYGECVTLNLLSRGDTQEEAIRRLQIAVFSYIHVVLSREESSAGLIPRRAPLTSWVRYYQHVLGARITNLFGGKYQLATKVFQTPLGGESRIVHC
jgi:predicted RNase H-like HicB family nuclease